MENPDELAITYSNGYVTKAQFLTYHVSENKFNCYLFFKNNGDVNPIEQLEIFDQLYEEFNLRKDDWTNFSVSYYPAAPWEKFDLCFYF